MVKPNLWIDRKPGAASGPTRQQASNPDGSQAGTSAHRRVLQVRGAGMVRVEVPADEPVSEVVAPAAGGGAAGGAGGGCVQGGAGRI